MGDKSGLLSLLTADGPDPRQADKLTTFGQFIGSWHLDMEVYEPDGTVRKRSGEWHFAWILGGRAVQDVLIVKNQDDEQEGIGTGLRVYDPDNGTWWVVWVGPARKECNILVARLTGDRIIMRRQSSLDDSVSHFEWTFFDITKNSYSCRGRQSTDGQTWQLVENLRAYRRNLSADVPPGLANQELCELSFWSSARSRCARLGERH